jgi:hypothetical protein
LTHHLARGVLFEQVFRAAKILQGSRMTTTVSERSGSRP